MEFNTKHRNNNNSEEDFFSNIEPQFDKTKKQVWDEITNNIDEGILPKTNQTTSTSLNTKIFYAIAASLLLFLATTIMMRFYSSSEYCPEGKQMVVELPCGTKVTLQPKSTITYFPLWWSFSRKVVLVGEADFDVVKGNEFNVISPMGNTIVIGTSFKVYARDYNYMVTCFTGSVKVVAFTRISIVLNTNQCAELVDGELKASKYTSQNQKQLNSEDTFNFKSIPLYKVLGEIEKQYNVKITSSIELRYNYTGIFSKQKSVEEVLYLVCKPYGLTFVVLSEKKYHIISI